MCVFYNREVRWLFSSGKKIAWIFAVVSGRRENIFLAKIAKDYHTRLGPPLIWLIKTSGSLTFVALLNFPISKRKNGMWWCGDWNWAKVTHLKLIDRWQKFTIFKCDGGRFFSRPISDPVVVAPYFGETWINYNTSLF